MPSLAELENVLVSPWGNSENSLVDPIARTIPAGVFTPVKPITVTDTGTAAMTGIGVPYPSFAGRITIIPKGAFTWTTAGNIAVAGTAVANRALDFIYVPALAKFFPSYV